MKNYKGFYYEFLEDINEYIVYWGSGFGENNIYSSIEILKEKVDLKIKRELEIKNNNKRKLLYEKNLKVYENKVYCNFNEFKKTLNKSLQNDKLTFFLNDKIKNVYTKVKNYMSYFYYDLKNFQQIEVLKDLGYKAEIKENGGYKAVYKDNSFYDLKKSEYLYLKFLCDNNINIKNVKERMINYNIAKSLNKNNYEYYKNEVLK